MREDERVLPVKVIASRIAAPIEIGGKQIEVLLDTGAPETLILSGKAARQVGIDVDALPEFGTGGTVLGPDGAALPRGGAVPLRRLRLRPASCDRRAEGHLQPGHGKRLGARLRRAPPLRAAHRLRRVPDLAEAHRAIRGSPSPVRTTPRARRSERCWFLIAARSTSARVVPDGAARRYGLRDGDAIVPAAGEKAFSPDEIVARIESRGELTVARQKGDVWIDLVLPDMASPEP